MASPWPETLRPVAPSLPAVRPRRVPALAVHVGLLLLTMAAVWTAGEQTWPGRGWHFMAALIAILFCHEMGHYVACRYYRVDATLPFFIPSPFLPPLWMPLSFIGTFGAVIRIRGRIPHRRALFDIGIAGPLAGFAVILLLLALGINDGTWVARPSDPTSAEAGIGMGAPLLLQWAERSVAPRAGMIYMIGPLGLAAWAGMLVTALNLLPVGQLDGGHVVHALLPRHSKKVTMAVLIVSLGLLYFRPFWLVWSLLMWTLGRRPHPPTWDDDAPVGRVRVVFGLLAAAVLALCFTASPIEISWPMFFESFRSLLTSR